jgi:xanthine dehydrogenase accessory factor
MRLRDEAAAWRAAGIDAVVVEVDRTRGSVPREQGTRMLVAADRVAGTIGGGHLEWQALECARARLGKGDEWRQDIALGPTLGQCCGGRLSLRYFALTAQVLDAWPDDKALFDLQLYGAGHVGRALVDALAGVPCRIAWIDEREDEFPGLPLPPQVRQVCVEPVEAEVRHGTPGGFYLVMTHSHELDLRITEAILARGDFGYLGLIGSATKRARFLQRFEARGVAPDRLQRMTCPIGVPGIAGKDPALIAIAVAAQLLQVAGA